MNALKLIDKLKTNELTVRDVEEWEQALIDRAVETTLRMIPQVVDYVARQTTYLNQLSVDFYKQNTDLNAHRALVASLLEQQEAQNPGMAYATLLENVAEQARKQLKASAGFSTLLPERPDVSKLDSIIGEL